MKKLICLFIITIIAIPTFCQSISSSEVPAVVMKTFNKKFKGVTGTGWAKNNDNFVASFSLEEQNAKAEFDPSGKWLSTLTTVDIKSLPPEASKYVKTNFKKAKIESVQQKQVPKDLLYVVIIPENIAGKTYKSELTFSEDGQLTDSKIPAEVEKAHDEAGSKGKKVKTTEPKDDDLQSTSTEEKDRKITQKELPTKTNDYLKANFKGLMDQFKESWQMKRDGKTIYKVVMKREGAKDVEVLYFNINGEKIDFKE